MANWILEERARLLKQLTRTTWLASAISFPAAAAGGGIAYLIGIQRALPPGAEGTLAILILAIALPAAVFLLVGVRRVLWTRTIRGEVERLQSQQFVTHYVDTVGAAGMRELSLVARTQVDTALEREHSGERATAREYADALRYLLLVDPA